MQGVDLEVRPADGASRRPAGLVSRARREEAARPAVVRLACHSFDLQVLPQRAAARHVQHLDAAADGQHREAVRDGPSREGQLDLVELRHQGQVAVVAGYGAVTSRLDVHATGQQKRVEELVVETDAVDFADDRNGKRGRAGQLESVEVRAVQRKLQRSFRAGKRPEWDAYNCHFSTGDGTRRCATSGSFALAWARRSLLISAMVTPSASASPLRTTPSGSTTMLRAQ